MTEFYTHCGTERYFDFDDKVCDEETGKALTVKEIVDLLNELNNQADAVRTELQLCEEENTELQKENEQLKQFKNEVFNLINAKIKLYSHKPVSAPISQPMSVNFDADVDRLARLSELEALKKELQE